MTAADKDLPAWLIGLLNAGRDLATLAEEDIEACGNSPPHDQDCEDCKPKCDAINRWMAAVWTARQHAAKALPAVGTPGVRDPDARCRMYAPGQPTNGGCFGDGHYLCCGCVHRVAEGES